MANNAISSAVNDAARASLVTPLKIYGSDVYTLSSNYLTWGDTHGIALTALAPTFGDQVISEENPNETVFILGDSTISTYDFGLLYSMFLTLSLAYAEQGVSVSVHETNTTKAGIHAIWLGSACMVYSSNLAEPLILMFSIQDTQELMKSKPIEVDNIYTGDTYIIEREMQELFITNKKNKAILCKFILSNYVISTYKKFLEEKPLSIKESVPVVQPKVAPNSILGMFIAKSSKYPDLKTVMKKYQEQGIMDDLSNIRDDLFIELDTPWDVDSIQTPTDSPNEVLNRPDISKYYGTIAYSDKSELVIIVNNHTGMLVYNPCFYNSDYSGILTENNPDFSQFYDVTQGCERIMRYCNTVLNLPVSSAKFDPSVFNLVKNAYMELKLPRISFQSSLGKVVIPENILETAVKSNSIAGIFCMVPLGMIGDIIIVKSSMGNCQEITPDTWSINEAFYDITEAVKDVER